MESQRRSLENQIRLIEVQMAELDVLIEAYSDASMMRERTAAEDQRQARLTQRHELQERLRGLHEEWRGLAQEEGLIASE